ncbi:hypothetical protein LY76DRAFT_596505 [Colletotrichum caudatum]|nr:hypothetical protein LY76DRAFT_596505 [Colletotrichum caudatum]
MVEDSTNEVRKMIDFMYTGDYTLDHESQKTDAENYADDLQAHARLFALAEKYQVDDLQSLSAGRYERMLENGFGVNGFLASLRDVYLLTPSSVRRLRDSAIRFSRKHMEIIIKKRKDEFDVITMSLTEFAKDLLSSYTEAPVLGNCYQCGNYKKMECLQLRCLQCGKGGGRTLQ